MNEYQRMSEENEKLRNENEKLRRKCEKLKRTLRDCTKGDTSPEDPKKMEEYPPLRDILFSIVQTSSTVTNGIEFLNALWNL